MAKIERGTDLKKTSVSDMEAYLLEYPKDTVPGVDYQVWQAITAWMQFWLSRGEENIESAVIGPDGLKIVKKKSE